MSKKQSGSAATSGPSEGKDIAVQGTNDDAAISKLSASSNGYYSDPFLPYFVSAGHRTKRAPLINRGYYARVSAITAVVNQFIATHSASAVSACQIIGLGAGYDTTYFKLLSQRKEPFKYIEIDFPDTARKKAALIRKTPTLMTLLQAVNAPPVAAAVAAAAATTTTATTTATASATATTAPAAASAIPSAGSSFDNGDVVIELLAVTTAVAASTDAKTGAASATATAADPNLPAFGGYSLIGADLRNLPAVTDAIRRAGGDLSLPTLIISECVLVYLQPAESKSVIEWAAATFKSGGAVFVTYEQILPWDAFGQTMMKNLLARGCPLLSLEAYPDLAAQTKRYLDAGFHVATAWDMNRVYRNFLDHTDLQRIESLEMFDEFEEWHMIQGHYSISMAGLIPPNSDGSPPDPKTTNHALARIGLLQHRAVADAIPTSASANKSSAAGGATAAASGTAPVTAPPAAGDATPLSAKLAVIEAYKKRQAAAAAAAAAGKPAATATATTTATATAKPAASK